MNNEYVQICYKGGLAGLAWLGLAWLGLAWLGYGFPIAPKRFISTNLNSNIIMNIYVV